LDENFEEHTEEISGIRARVFQHEYDHLQGKVFVDRLSPLRKTLLKRRLNDIANNKVRTSYRMKMNSVKKK
jgi:peptide deformylase